MSILPKSGGEQTLIELDPPPPALGAKSELTKRSTYQSSALVVITRPLVLLTVVIVVVTSVPNCKDSKHNDSMSLAFEIRGSTHISTSITLFSILTRDRRLASCQKPKERKLDDCNYSSS